MKIETIAIHGGNKTSADTGAVIQPLTLSSTFLRGPEGDYPGGYIYSRSQNPNRESLEKVLAMLDEGVDACAFSSGNAAGMSVFQALEPGSHLICPDDMYHGLRNQLKLVFKDILTFDFIDLSDEEQIRSTINSKTKLIWAETPSNPLLKILDIAQLSKIAKQHQCMLVVDNTFSSPVFQKPLLLGADFVMYSTTKYHGGHSDVTGGAIIAKKQSPFFEKVKIIQGYGGAIPSPFDCYMIVKGIKTLPYRMKGHYENAMKLALFLKSNKAVEEVFYPGLESHKNHKIARSQMSGFGGVLSFTLKSGEEAAKKLVNNVKIFTQATSVGGIESLIEHRYSVEGPDTKTPRNLIRISTGLENIEDLIEDLSLTINKL